VPACPQDSSATINIAAEVMDHLCRIEEFGVNSRYHIGHSDGVQDESLSLAALG